MAKVKVSRREYTRLRQEAHEKLLKLIRCHGPAEEAARLLKEAKEAKEAAKNARKQSA